MRAPAVPRTRPKILLPCAAVLALTVLSGCKFQATADEQNGRMLFVQRCGTCHVLSEAGTQSTVGPDLDAAFAEARRNGMDSDTFEGVIKSQVENPRPSTDDPRVSMPANLVTGDDLEDVAAYVASVAGVPGAKPPAAAGGPGGQVFASNGCGSCHVLQAAGATGTVGPDLDKVLKGQTAAEVMESIVDPNAKIAKGYPANVMPETFKSLPKDQLKQLVDFLLKSAS
jgi:cytochrome c2